MFPGEPGDDHRYDDIIDLPRPVSAAHPPMPLASRAAQFAPFAALTGFGRTGDPVAAWLEAGGERIAKTRERLERIAPLFERSDFASRAALRRLVPELRREPAERRWLDLVLRLGIW